MKNAIIKLFIAGVFGVAYSAGGSDWAPLYVRRFIAPSILCGGMFYFSRSWKSLVQLPIMFFSLSIGYGSDFLWTKILKRGLFGLANGVSSSGYNMFKKRWLLVGFQVVLLIAAYIAFGVWNPFQVPGGDRIEEMFLGLLIALIPILSS